MNPGRMADKPRMVQWWEIREAAKCSGGMAVMMALGRLAPNRRIVYTMCRGRVVGWKTLMFARRNEIAIRAYATTRRTNINISWRHWTNIQWTGWHENRRSRGYAGHRVDKVKTCCFKNLLNTVVLHKSKSRNMSGHELAKRSNGDGRNFWTKR